MNPATIPVGPGAIVKVDGALMCLKQFVTSDSIIARDLATSLEKTVRLNEIQHSSYKEDASRADLAELSEDDWAKAVDTYKAIHPLLEKPNRTRKDVRAVADELLVSPATVYRWIDRVERYGTVTCLLRKNRADKGVGRISPPVERILNEVIVAEYLSGQKRKQTRILSLVESRCRQEGVPVPSKATLVRRIDKIAPEERARRRNGRNEALKYRPIRGSFPGADQPHSVWQIDHTLVDLVLVDEIHRIPIGRPWITVAIDVYSRMVVGWYLSFDPPGTLGTGICISNAVLSKDALLAKLGVPYPWPCQGKPRTIQADNAKEFRGNTLRDACQEHSIHLKFRKVKKPNYGAHIERLLGTLLTEIHELEGTTFSNPKEAENYDSDGHAVMTLPEFELWLANLILGRYHHRNHSGIKSSPLKRYNDGIVGDETRPGIGVLPVPADPEALRIDFLPFEKRTIQPYGVMLDNILYYAPVLDRWIGARDPTNRRVKRKFIFRRDPRDISSILFYDPDATRYFRVSYRDVTRPAISLWELRAVQHHLAAQGRKNIDEDTLFHAFSEMRRIEESAKSLTRKQRRNQERRRHHQQAPILTKTPAADQAPSAEPSNDATTLDLSNIKPFDEIEPV